MRPRGHARCRKTAPPHHLGDLIALPETGGNYFSSQFSYNARTMEEIVKEAGEPDLTPPLECRRTVGTRASVSDSPSDRAISYCATAEHNLLQHHADRSVKETSRRIDSRVNERSTTRKSAICDLALLENLRVRYEQRNGSRRIHYYEQSDQDGDNGCISIHSIRAPHLRRDREYSLKAVPGRGRQRLWLPCGLPGCP